MEIRIHVSVAVVFDNVEKKKQENKYDCLK